MKRIITLFVGLVAFAGVALADGYNYLTVQKTDGTEQSFTAQGLVLTFEDGNMIATEGGTQATFALVDLYKMFFSNEATGISDINADAKTDGPVAVYGVSGSSMGTYKNLDEARAQLHKGVYVVRENGKTRKIAIR